MIPPRFDDIEEDHVDEYCSSRHIDGSHRRSEENKAVQELSDVDLMAKSNCEDQ